MSDDTSLAADLSEAMGGSFSPSSASEASTDTADTGAVIEGTATTAPAPVQPAADPVRQKQGPIPFDVHHTALENARTKAVEELRARVGWAEQIDPQEFQQVQHFVRTLQADPVAGLQQLMAEIRKNPQHDAAIRSLAARALAQRQQAQAADQEPQLEMVPVELSDGRIVKFATAESTAAREAWIQRKATEAATAQLQPHLQTLHGLQQREQAIAQQQQVDHFVSTTFADMQTWPGMETADAKAAVANELARARIDPNDPREVALALDRAYRKTILPSLSASSRQAVLSDLHQKAQTNTVSPNQPSTGAPVKDSERSYRDLFRSELAARGRR
jgi:hypothetical protein